MKYYWGALTFAVCVAIGGSVNAELDQQRYKFAVAEYVETLKELNEKNPDQVQGALDATFNGYLQCYSHRGYLINRYPDSDAASRYKVEQDRFVLNFMYLANALEELGIAKANDMLDGFRPAVDRSYQNIGEVYQRSKNNGSSVASDELLQLVEYCNHWARQAQDVEHEVDHKIRLDKILKE